MPHYLSLLAFKGTVILCPSQKLCNISIFTFFTSLPLQMSKEILLLL